MQKGSLIRSSRRQGPDVWEYRWRESCSGQRRKHRRIVIGSLNILKDESAALKSISALRRDININDRRIRTKPLRLAELVEHYRQKELTTDNEWKTLSTRVTYEGYLRKWIVPKWDTSIRARSRSNWLQISTNVAALDCALHQRINRSLDLTAKCLKWEANVFLLADLRTNRTIEGPIIPGRNGGKNELMGFRTAVPGQAP